MPGITSKVYTSQKKEPTRPLNQDQNMLLSLHDDVFQVAGTFKVDVTRKALIRGKLNNNLLLASSR